MGIIILWIGICMLVGVVGKDRKIGFGMAFFWALILSPIIGLVIALLSDKNKKEPEYISTRHSSRDYEEKSEVSKYSNNQATQTKSNSTDKKISIQEWREKNPYKSINDYYRENGK